MIDSSELKDVIGLGVAGNFAGHLEQAGEASDFVGVEVKEAQAPKGIFPFYVPPGDGTSKSFLHTFPIASDRIQMEDPDDTLQIEPEVALLCRLEYEGEGADKRVVRVVPERFGAHNDCSIRREGAPKISHKKNWGPNSKGTSNALLPIDRFAPGGVLDHYRLVSYLERDGLHLYGVDSAVSSYSYFHEKLLDWLVEKMNTQQDAGPLESIRDWLAVAAHPERALISIGATRYTEFGETTFLEPGDRSIVVVYDANRHDEATIREIATPAEAQADELAEQGISVLSQWIV